MATHEAMAKEKARRFFASAEDIDREIERHRLDVVEPHLDALTELIAPANPTRQEATKRYLLKVADEVAGKDAGPVLKMVAVSIVLYDA
jgi:hypothetical protein